MPGSPLSSLSDPEIMAIPVESRKVVPICLGSSLVKSYPMLPYYVLAESLSAPVKLVRLKTESTPIGLALRPSASPPYGGSYYLPY